MPSNWACPGSNGRNHGPRTVPPPLIRGCPVKDAVTEVYPIDAVKKRAGSTSSAIIT